MSLLEQIRKPKITIFVAILLNIIIRIPRMLNASGFDGMLLVWESQLLLNGSFFSKGFNLFSSMGFYPFSSYPIGSVLLMCFFLLITNRHLMISIILFDFIMITCLVFSTYFLTKELGLTFPKNILFLLILTTLPNILLFSFYTPSARIPFYVFIPLILVFLLRFNKQKKFYNLLVAIVISFISNFFHRAGFMTIIPIAISIGIYLLNIISKKDFISDVHNNEIDFTDFSPRKQKLAQAMNFLRKRIWVLLILFMFVCAFILNNTLFKGLWPIVYFDTYCAFKIVPFGSILYTLFQPFIDQWFYYGIAFFLLILGTILVFIGKDNSLLSNFENNSSLYFIFYIIPFVFIFRIVYSIYFISFLVTLISVETLLDLNSKEKVANVFIPVMAMFSCLFIIAYHFFIEAILPYTILAFFILLVTIAYFFTKIPKVKDFIISKLANYDLVNLRIKFYFLCVLILFNSLFMTDRQAIFHTRNGYMTAQINAEEIEIAEFLKSQELGTFDSFDHIMSTHIGALTGWYFIQDSHSQSVFLLDSYLANITWSLKPFYTWYDGNFIDCNFTLGSQYYYMLIQEDCLSMKSLTIMSVFNLKYFITEKDSSIIFKYENIIDSPFVKSLALYTPLVKTTEHFNVWNVSTLY